MRRPKSTPTEMEDDGDFYEPPCRQLLREQHICENCGKKLTLHTLLYRHTCDPMEARRERALVQAREAAERAHMESVPAIAGQASATPPRQALLAQVSRFGARR